VTMANKTTREWADALTNETRVSRLTSMIYEIRGEARAPSMIMGQPIEVYLEVAYERTRQDYLWGVQNHRPEWYMTILAEEVGEANKAILEGDMAQYRVEMTHVAAVAIAMIECLDRGEYKDTPQVLRVKMPEPMPASMRENHVVMTAKELYKVISHAREEGRMQEQAMRPSPILEEMPMKEAKPGPYRYEPASMKVRCGCGYDPEDETFEQPAPAGPPKRKPYPVDNQDPECPPDETAEYDAGRKAVE